MSFFKLSPHSEGDAVSAAAPSESDASAPGVKNRRVSEDASSTSQHHLAPSIGRAPRSCSTFTAMLIGATGSGKSAFAWNIGRRGAGGRSGFLHGTRTMQVHEPVIFADPRANAAPDSTIILRLLDTVGNNDPHQSLSMDKHVNMIIHDCLRVAGPVHVIVLCITNGRNFQGLEEHTLFMLRALKLLGFTNEHFLVLLTHSDVQDSALTMSQLLQTEIMRELGITQVSQIMAGVTQDRRDIAEHNVEQLRKVDETVQSVLLHLVDPARPAPVRYSHSFDKLAQKSDLVLKWFDATIALPCQRWLPKSRFGFPGFMPILLLLLIAVIVYQIYYPPSLAGERNLWTMTSSFARNLVHSSPIKISWT